MSIPGVVQNELDQQTGAVAVGNGEVCVVFGCSSAGTAAVPAAYAGNQQASLVAAFGYGPGPQMTSQMLARGKRAVFCKVATAAAGTTGPVTVANPGTAGSPTAVGANDTRLIKIEVLTSGALGTAGITFRYSLDGGVTWSRAIALGTALSYVIPNTGTTITFGIAAGTVLATTTWTLRTVEPTWDATGIAAAFVALTASGVEWDFFQVVGPCSKTLHDAIKSALTTLVTSLKKKTSGILEARRQDPSTSETEAAWMTSIGTDYDTADASNLGVGAGEIRMYSPILRTFDMRPIAWDAALRAVLVDSLKYELGRVKADGNGGPITGALFDSAGNPIGHNEERVPGLDTTGTGGTRRFITARTHPTKGKFAYLTRANMMCLPGSDFSSWRLRRGMDVACNTTMGILTNEIQETPVLEPVGSPRAGKISIAYAKAVESACKSALYQRLVKPGRVSDAYVVVNLDDNILSTKKIKVKTRIVPLGQIDFIEEEIAYENPVLSTEGA